MGTIKEEEKLIKFKQGKTSKEEEENKDKNKESSTLYTKRKRKVKEGLYALVNLLF